MSESQNTCTSSNSSQEEELVSTTMTDTTIDEATLALADELELDMDNSATTEGDASESEDSSVCDDAPHQAIEKTTTTTEQVVEQIVTTKKVDQVSPSAPQWTPVNVPHPTTGGKGIKQARGGYIEPSQTAYSPPPDHDDDADINTPEDGDLGKVVEDTAITDSDEDEQPEKDNQPATGHPKTGGKGLMVPIKLEKLKTETAERMKTHLARAGLDIKGTKDDLMVRILLSENGLDLQTYSLRCLILLGPMWNLRQLKDRCTELGVPEADRKTSSKTKLAQELLLAEHEQGIIIADDDNGPKTSAWSVPTKSKAPKPKASTTSTPAKTDLKRKHHDSADATEDEGPDAKRAKADDSGTPDGNGKGVSSSGASTSRPKKAPRKRPAQSKAVVPEDNNTSNIGTSPQAEPSTAGTSKPKRKRTGDEEADQDGHPNSKRTKKNDSSILAAAASKKAPTSQLVKQATKEKPPTKPKARLSMPSSVTNVTFGIPDKVASDVLFENQPIPDPVADAAIRILSGRSEDSDASRVHLHRLRLPKYQAYCQMHVDERSDEDKSWLDNQRFWEAYEMKAVCEEIGEDYTDGTFEDEMIYEEPNGMNVRDYFRFLKDPEGDERMTKEERDDLRERLSRYSALKKLQVADPEFKKARNGKEAPWGVV